jgi:hypothetical protein
VCVCYCSCRSKAKKVSDPPELEPFRSACYLLDIQGEQVNVPINLVRQKARWCGTGEAPKGAWIDFAQVKATRNIVAFVMGNGGRPAGDSSHLCDNRNCVIPSHLIDESSVRNNARKGCVRWRVDRRTQTLTDKCVHEPKCITYQIVE